MPELPEVEALRGFLERELVGATVVRAEVAAFSALKTFALPLSALLGLEVEGVERRGKFLGIGVGGLWLVFHLARAGWLRWYDVAPATPAKPGKGPLAARFVVEGPDAGAAGRRRGFDLTEAGTQKHLALYVVADLADVGGIASLGPDPLAAGFTEADFAAVLAAHGRTQIKGLLRDQRIFAGIGNAYSDEILFAAGLSPFRLTDALAAGEVSRLYAATQQVLSDAIARASGQPPSALKDGKRSSLRVHGRKGEVCGVCGSVIAEVSFADSFWNYCPGCQTGGKVLADRRLSRLLK